MVALNVMANKTNTKTNDKKAEEVKNCGKGNCNKKTNAKEKDCK